MNGFDSEGSKSHIDKMCGINFETLPNHNRKMSGKHNNIISIITFQLNLITTEWF